MIVIIVTPCRDVENIHPIFGISPFCHIYGPVYNEHGLAKWIHDDLLLFFAMLFSNLNRLISDTVMNLFLNSQILYSYSYSDTQKSNSISQNKGSLRKQCQNWRCKANFKNNYVCCMQVLHLKPNVILCFCIIGFKLYCLATVFFFKIQNGQLESYLFFYCLISRKRIQIYNFSRNLVLKITVNIKWR